MITPPLSDSDPTTVDKPLSSSSSSSSCSDDVPAQANKRARRFTPGAYPTHVYLSVECADLQSRAQLQQTVREHRDLLPDAADWTVLDATSALHISLCRSAPVDVQYGATLEAELRRLARSLCGEQRDDAGLLRVSACASRYLVNEQRDRAFLALLLDEHSRSGLRLRQWIAGVDRIFGQFELAPYHENPLPHVSVAFTSVLPDENDAQAAERDLSGNVTFRIKALTIVRGGATIEIALPAS